MKVGIVLLWVFFVCQAISGDSDREANNDKIPKEREKAIQALKEVNEQLKNEVNI